MISVDKLCDAMSHGRINPGNGVVTFVTPILLAKLPGVAF